jgi:hypothetical protein
MHALIEKLLRITGAAGVLTEAQRAAVEAGRFYADRACADTFDQACARSAQPVQSGQSDPVVSAIFVRPQIGRS